MVAAVRKLHEMVRPGGKLAITSWRKNVFEPAKRVFWQAIATAIPNIRAILGRRS